MDKYGVLTWYSTYNYGTALQAYSVTKILNDNGFKAEIIAYRKNCSVAKKSKLDRIKETMVRIPPAMVRRIFWSQLRKKKELFEKFLSNDMPQSKPYFTKDELVKDVRDYKGFVCGSDQIWTPVPEGMDTTYFLDFVPNDIKKISYAPSIGYPSIPKEKKEVMGQLISRIDYLSIREEHGAELIKEICDCNAKVVVDPTLLITKEKWVEFAVKSDIEEPYILCYFLGKRKETRKFAEDLKRKTGFKIINIPVEIGDFFWGDEIRLAVGPKEFVGLIMGASYICSDSFHGVIFSANLEKNFFALCRYKSNDKKNQNLRLVNILSKLDLLDQMVMDEEKYCMDDYMEINYDKSRKKLSEQRDESLKFLLDAIVN